MNIKYGYTTDNPPNLTSVSVDDKNIYTWSQQTETRVEDEQNSNPTSTDNLDKHKVNLAKLRNGQCSPASEISLRGALNLAPAGSAPNVQNFNYSAANSSTNGGSSTDLQAIFATNAVGLGGGYVGVGASNSRAPAVMAMVNEGGADVTFHGVAEGGGVFVGAPDVDGEIKRLAPPTMASENAPVLSIGQGSAAVDGLMATMGGGTAREPRPDWNETQYGYVGKTSTDQPGQYSVYGYGQAENTSEYAPQQYSQKGGIALGYTNAAKLG